MRMPIKQQFKNATGLGDMVAIVAEPIKQAIINHAPEPIAKAMENCNCSERRAKLNQLFPIS
jgi:hypothetical protein